MVFVTAVFPDAPSAGIAARFRSIIDRLCRALERHAVQDWTATAFVGIIVANLRCRLERFVALKARFDAGVPPPAPRPARKRAPADGEMAERVFDFVPRERGWLKKLTEQDGAAAFWQLRDLLAEPEFAAFIAADPRVGRVLRPLWWMLSPKLGLPDVLLPPPRPASLTAPDGQTRRRGSGRAAPRPPRSRIVWVRFPFRTRSGPSVA